MTNTATSDNHQTVDQKLVALGKRICKELQDAKGYIISRKPIRTVMKAGFDDDGTPLVVIYTNAKTSVYENNPVRVFIRPGASPDRPEVLLRVNEGRTDLIKADNINTVIADVVKDVMFHKVVCRHIEPATFSLISSQLPISMAISPKEAQAIEDGQTAREATKLAIRSRAKPLAYD